MRSKKLIQSKSDILEFFQEASVSKKELLIGLEVEKSAVFDQDLSPVQYSGPYGYASILKKLSEEVGWKITGQEGGKITSLKRGDSEIHIEFDGRIELVSKPRKRLYNLCREYQMHANEIDQISREFGVRWVSLGWKPFAKIDEVNIAFPEKFKAESNHAIKNYPDLDKKIYTGWTKKTDGVHVNFGYTSEKDAINKFQTMLRVSPILTAMFANSPLNTGKFSGFLNNRYNSTLSCSPHRTQIRKEFLEDGFSFEKWIDYLIKLPMRRIDRKGKQIFIPLTFEEYIKKGYKKHRARIEDFYLHIKSVWSEMRIKHYLEYRGLDTVPPHLIPAIPAIVRAITLNQDVMSECKKITENWTFNDHLEIRKGICKTGLQTRAPDGKKILDLAKELLEIASFSLKKQHQEIKDRTDASRFLWPIKEYIFVREQSPAEYIMEMWNGKWHKDPRKLIEWSESLVFDKTNN